MVFIYSKVVMAMHEKWMKEALKQAKKAYQLDEVPIGAVIVCNGEIISRGYNKREKKQMSISHAEIEAIQSACRKKQSWRLDDCELYVTLEPCAMCAGAIMQARIKTVYYGAADPKGGVLSSLFAMYEQKGFNHYPGVVGGVLEETCGLILTQYFRTKRLEKKKNKLK